MISFILLSDRDIKCALACRYDAKCVRKARYIWYAMHGLIDGSIRVLYKCFPVIPRGLDASICHYLSSSDKCVYIGITAASKRGGRDMASGIAVVWSLRETRFYKGRYCGLPWPSFRPPVNIVYWLPPPISQTLVTRSCPSPTANKPRAVIWHWLSYPASLPAGISLWRIVRFPRHHVQLCPNNEGSCNKRISERILREVLKADIKRARYYFIVLSLERGKILTDLIYNTIGM